VSALKILLVGLGSIGQRHARNLRTLLGDDVELLAHRMRRTAPLIGPDLTADPGGDVEAAYGIRPFNELDEALAERPDLVFVTNPAHLHVSTARAAAEAGAHLFVEKPLSHTWDGVPELIELVEGRGVTGLVGYQLRFHPGFRQLRRLVDEGSLGRLLGARFAFGEYLPGWHPWEDYREANAALADQGGGVILAQIHDLDVAYGLFGMPRRVFTVGGKRSTLELEVEDTASTLLDVDGLPVHLHQDLVERPPRRTYELIGEEARAVWDYYADTVALVRADGSAELTRFEGLERNDLFLDELRHLLACVEGSEQPVVDVRAGADSLAIALAAKRSLETGEAVALG
jgi:predicted dehydrogenase